MGTMMSPSRNNGCRLFFAQFTGFFNKFAGRKGLLFGTP
jgi:hypothetical protein